MNIDQMAHEFALASFAGVTGESFKDIATSSYAYALAMKAESEKHQNKSRPAVLEDWQPDWSLAPEWAKWWAIAKDGSAYWFNKSKPRMMSDYFETTYCGFGKMPFAEAPSFGYQGDWRDSLRMRPEHEDKS